MGKVVFLGNGKTFDCDYFIENENSLYMRLYGTDVAVIAGSLVTNNGQFQYGGKVYTGYSDIELIRFEGETTFVKIRSGK